MSTCRLKVVVKTVIHATLGVDYEEKIGSV